MSDSAAQSADRTSAIKLRAEIKELSEGHSHISNAGPPIDGSPKPPVLTSIITADSNIQIPSKNALAVADVRCISRLPRCFTHAWGTITLKRRNITGQRIKNARLNSNSRIFGEREPMLDAHLRSPAPQITGIRQRRNCQRRQSRGSKRREENTILSRNYRGIRPIQANCTGAQTNDSGCRAIWYVREASGEIKFHVGAGAGPGNIWPESFNSNLRLTK